MQPQSRTQSPKCESLSSETLDLRAGFVASLCLIRAHLSWALRDVSSERHSQVGASVKFALKGREEMKRRVACLVISDSRCWWHSFFIVMVPLLINRIQFVAVDPYQS